MKIKNLQLHFNNNDYVTIKGENLGIFSILNSRTSYEKINDKFYQMLACDAIKMEINKDANIDLQIYEDKDDFIKLFDRILINDLSFIIFSFTLDDDKPEDDENNIRTYQYFLPIKEETISNGNEITTKLSILTENEYCTSMISDLGHLYIHVSTSDTIDVNKAFEFDEILDEEVVNSRFVKTTNKNTNENTNEIESVTPDNIMG